MAVAVAVFVVALACLMVLVVAVYLFHFAEEDWDPLTCWPGSLVHIEIALTNRIDSVCALWDFDLVDLVAALADCLPPSVLLYSFWLVAICRDCAEALW